MHIIDKIFNKIKNSIWDSILSLSGTLPGLDSLIAWYKGPTEDEGLLADGSGLFHTGQVKGISVAGDGSGAGAITGLLTSATFTVGTGSDSPTCTSNGVLTIASGDNVWGLKIYHAGVLFATLNMECKGATVELDASGNGNDCTWSGFTGDIYQEHTDGSGFDPNVLGFSERENLLVAGDEDVSTWSMSNATYVGGLFTIQNAGYVRLTNAALTAEAHIFGVEFTAISGTAKLRMYDGVAAIDDDIISTGIAYVTGVTAATDNGAFYIRNDSGSVITFSIKEPFLQKGSTPSSYVDPHTTGRQPAGFQDNTDYGPNIAPDMIPVDMGCLQGDGTGQVLITGLLTTDTISVGTGSGTPTCTTNGELDIADGTQVWDLTITRAAATWAFYPMVNGHPTHNSTITMVEDIVGGNHGTATSFVSTAWGVRGGDAGVGTVELLTNGDFANWTGDDPDNWVVSGEDAANYIEESPAGSLHIVSDNTAILHARQNGMLTAGERYQCTVNASAASGDLTIRSYSTANTYTNITSSGIHTFEFNAVDTGLTIQRGGVVDATIISISLKRVYPDYDTDFALTQGMSLDRVEEELVTNGGFDADTNWEYETTENWTIANGIASIDSTATSNGRFTQTPAILTVGHEYIISYEIISRTAGEMKVIAGNNEGSYNSTVGVHTEQLICTSNTTFFLYAGFGFIGSVDNVSVKRVIKGYNAVTDGTHQDGTSPRYEANTWALARLLPCSWKGALGPKTQAVTPQFIDEGDIYLCDEPTVGENSQVYIGTKGMAVYDSDQLDNVAAIDRVLDVLGDDIPRTFAIISGTPTIDGDEITLADEAAEVRNSTYWDVGKTYVVSCLVENYVGTGNIVLPYDGYGVSPRKIVTASGLYIYKYTPMDSTNLVVYSVAGHTAKVTVNSIKEISAELGPELVTNGTFLTDTDWTKGTGWTIASDVASSDGTQVAVSDLSQDVLTDATEYQIEFELSNVSAGSITAFAGSDSGTARTADGRYRETLTCATDTVLDIQASADFVGSVDNVTCREVIGNGSCSITTGSLTAEGEDTGGFPYTLPLTLE